VDMDVNKLLTALDNEKNEKIMNYSTKKIKQMNFDILKELHLSKEQTHLILDKLLDYVYVDELNDLREGTYLRWIDLKDPGRLELSRGGIFCETKITDSGIQLVCKNHFGRHFQIKMDEHLLFRKLMGQESVLIQALDILEK
jgi:hypothetical protein